MKTDFIRLQSGCRTIEHMSTKRLTSIIVRQETPVFFHQDPSNRIVYTFFCHYEYQKRLMRNFTYRGPKYEYQ